MYAEEKRVVIVTPAGRRGYMEILLPQVQRVCDNLKTTDILDLYRVWAQRPPV